MAKLPDDRICHCYSDDGITINVDFSPLVRCCDCFYSQHCRTQWHKNILMCFLWHKDGIAVFNDGFCNYGKKKEESE